MSKATSAQMSAFAATPLHVANEIADLTATQLLQAPGEGEWSIHEVLIHLADSESIGFWRLRKTLAEQEPRLDVYDEAAWARNLLYLQQDHKLALQLFSDLRASSAALLQLIPEEAWEHTAIHAERGKLTVYDLFITYLEHGENHLQQIARIKQALFQK